eukprot:c2086_g1_i1.p1 GENE.c2086_g1_i1~~c2086_g1_i1.p1  ORF type:complete len:298 (-),score=48.40 c2086_g1_i1:57-950(-)
MGRNASNMSYAVVVLGDDGIGRQSLAQAIQRTAWDTEDDEPSPFRQSRDLAQSFCLVNDKPVRVQFHQPRPTMGRYRVRTLPNGEAEDPAWRQVNAVMICFSLSDRVSFENAALRHARRLRAAAIKPPVFLVGLASDEPKAVSREDAEELAAIIEAVGYYEINPTEYLRICPPVPAKTQPNSLNHKQKKIKIQHSKPPAPVLNPTQLKPLRHVPAGGVEEFLDAVICAAAGQVFQATEVPKPHLADDLEKFHATLMARHPRLGSSCCEGMRTLPPELWLKIFNLAACNLRVRFLGSA